MTMRLENPFKVGGAIEGRFITGRGEEIKQVARALVEPEGLIVRAPARMGVTTVLEAAIARVEATGTIAMLVNVGTCSVPTDLAVRMLQSLSDSMGREGPEAIRKIAARAQRRMEFRTEGRDAASRVFLNVRLREETQPEQIKTLLAVMDGIESEAEAMGRNLALVLDEAHAVEGLLGAGLGELRRCIADHSRICYVMGWREPSADRLLGWLRKDGSSILDLEPMEGETMAKWVDARMEACGVKPAGAGTRLVKMTGRRTGDLLRHGRALFEIAGTTSAVRAGDAERAFHWVIEEQETMISAEWSRLTAAQQNVLRAIAAGVSQLTGRGARVTFGLTTSAAVSQSARALVEKSWLVAARKGYVFDSPFYQGWVMKKALPDVGIFEAETP